MPTGAFGAWMRQRRRAMGLTITECANRAGVRQPVWSEWEAGKSHPEKTTVAKVAKALEVDESVAMLAAGYADPHMEPDEELAAFIKAQELRLPDLKRSKFRQAARQQVELLADAMR